MRSRWPKVMVAGLVGAGLYRSALRPWQERWGASDEEVHAGLPGDDLVAEPARQVTRAVTVEAPPGQVWPWVIQMGADRGGFYSYDWLEDLFGLGIHSADRIVPEWQQRAVGDLVLASAKGGAGWYVMEARPGEALVVKMGDLKAGRPAGRDERWGWEFLWTFALQDAGPGSTRLLVRERVGFGNPFVRALMAPVGVVSFVMTRKMLLGIKDRAERAQGARPSEIRARR